ncbi:MAG: DNA polymerase Y family protein, partial [Pseudomonadota bacterium]
MPRRIISVALPWLQAEHRLRGEGQSGLDQPFAVVEHAQGTARLAGVNRAATKAGLSAGQALTDARAICPGIVTRPASSERLATFQTALTRWAERFSPLTSTDQSNALVLDATGCTHLFGGEAPMLEALTQALAEHGLTARAAMADTKGAAWALAHHGRQQIAPPGRTRQAIADLPTTALR